MPYLIDLGGRSMAKTTEQSDGIFPAKSWGWLRAPSECNRTCDLEYIITHPAVKEAVEEDLYDAHR
jgi:hypothetical protein